MVDVKKKERLLVGTGGGSFRGFPRSITHTWYILPSPWKSDGKGSRKIEEESIGSSSSHSLKNTTRRASGQINNFRFANFQYKNHNLAIFPSALSTDGKGLLQMY